MTTPPDPPDRFAPPNSSGPVPPAPIPAGAPAPPVPLGPPAGPVTGWSGAPTPQPPKPPAQAIPYSGYAPGVYYAPGTGAPVPQAPLDPLAVASVPAALVGPVGLGLGIAGILRTKNGQRRGRTLALIGTGLGGAVTVGGVITGIVLGVAGAGWNTLPADVAQATTANTVQVSVGNCIEQLPTEGDSATTVRVVPCADSHRVQAVANATLPDGKFPGTERVTALTSAVCGTDVLGEEPQEGVDRILWVPSEESWAKGDRTGLCLVWSSSPLTEDYTG